MFKRHRRKRNVNLNIIAEHAGEWTDNDRVALHGFIGSRAGQKLLANLEHTLYLETLSSKQQTEWLDGRRAGLAMAIMALRDLADISVILPDEDAETPE